MLRKRDIRRRFDRAAGTFDTVDFVHAVTRDGLLARLEPLQIDARSILDLGAATGATGRSLRRRFRRAQVTSLDLSHAMLRQARKHKPLFAKGLFVQADAVRLPFCDASFDLVVSNQLLPWLPDPQPAFGEVGRVLRPGGVFAFATLGPDSLQELDRAWASVDAGAHVNHFPDMHDLGDGLVRAGLADPVLDVDRLSIRYDNAHKLFAEMTAAGARNALAARARGLTGRRRFRAMTDTLTAAGAVELGLELVYGHCWGRGPNPGGGQVRIAADAIGRRRRNR